MKPRRSLKKKFLILAIGSLLASDLAYGQSTVGSIYGQVPAGDGQRIVVRSDTGVTREIAVSGNGRYNITQLPLGTYTVTLYQGDQPVRTQEDVVLRVGVGENVSFESSSDGIQKLDGVKVTGSRAPAIDVTSVDSRTVITADQLKALPLGRSAEAAALLAPGVVPGGTAATGRFGAPLASFGGAAVVENLYYVNGFNTTDPNQGQGGLTLPYGAIDQEEIYTGGYSAQYGRSNGGVLNIIGKSGTNEWKFGGTVQWIPESFRSRQDDISYTTLPKPNTPATGLLYQPRSESHSETTTYDAYVGGPILRDRLFFFAAAEQNRTNGFSVGNVNSDLATSYTTKNPKAYGKINWNITDDHLLELTGDYNQVKTTGTQYHYDFVNRKQGAYKAMSNEDTTGGHFWSAKYTGYITDTLTLTAQYGKMDLTTESIPVGLNNADPYINGAINQNPALNGGKPNNGFQTVSGISSTDYATRTLRAGLSWVIGDHTINAGIDNLKSDAFNIGGNVPTGPGGYSWTYGYTATPNEALIPAIGVPAPGAFANGASGYYVTRDVTRTGGNLFTTQNGQYLEDNWQVTEKVLLSLGLRHDGYTNKNNNHDTYIKQDNLWQPRLGFSWDVNGDSTLKVFGNAGLYDMNQPLATDAWLANSALNTQQYYTYSGIAANGEPTGLTEMSKPVSINGSYGQSPDPRQIYAKDLKPQDQAEYIIGFVKAVDARWSYGAKFTRRDLRHVIDDYCDWGTVQKIALQQGVTAVGIEDKCWQINPGIDNTFAVQDAAGNYHDVRVTREQMDFPKLSRKYNGVNLFLEHGFDGTWYGKLDYTWSRAYGNSEGQSQTRTDSIGGTQQTDWDNPAVMVNSNGPQGNDHTHQIKLFGYYQITPEWQAGGNLAMISGGPKYCLGKYGTDQSMPFGYSAFYWCDGKPAAPGSKGRMGWHNSLDLGLHYRPDFADQKLGFHLDVLNVFNTQAVLNRYWRYRPDRTQDRWPMYEMPTSTQQPRYARLSVTYDF